MDLFKLLENEHQVYTSFYLFLRPLHLRQFNSRIKLFLFLYVANTLNSRNTTNKVIENANDGCSNKFPE